MTESKIYADNFKCSFGNSDQFLVLAPGENRHSGLGENRQFWPGENRQSLFTI